MRRLRKAIGLGIAIAAIGIALRPTAVGVRLEEDLGLRWLFTVRGPVEPPGGVVVVSIDKSSSDQLGLTETWPPSRHVHASVLRSLSRHGVSAIIMDVFFKVRRTADEDDDLANAIAESGRVALFESVDRLRYSGGEIVQTRSPICPEESDRRPLGQRERGSRECRATEILRHVDDRAFAGQASQRVDVRPLDFDREMKDVSSCVHPPPTPRSMPAEAVT